MASSMINPRLKIGMICVFDVFLLLDIAGSLIGIFTSNVWTFRITIGTRTEHVKVGLREACLSIDDAAKIGDWSCKPFSEDANDTGYTDIDIVTYCLVASIAAAGVGVLVSIVAILLRHRKAFKPIVFATVALAFGAGATCAVTVAYLAGDDSVKEIVPKWITTPRPYLLDKKLDSGWTFYVICTACGCGLLSGILAAILLFIVWDEEEYSSYMDELKNELSQSDEVKKNTELNSKLAYDENKLNEFFTVNQFGHSMDGFHKSKINEVPVDKRDRVNYDAIIQQRRTLNKQELENQKLHEEQKQMAAELEQQLAEEQREVARQNEKLRRQRLKLESEARELQRIRETYHPQSYTSLQHAADSTQFFYDDIGGPHEVSDSRYHAKSGDYPRPADDLREFRMGRKASYDSRDDSLERAMVREDLRLSAAYDQYYNEPY